MLIEIVLVGGYPPPHTGLVLLWPSYTLFGGLAGMMAFLTYRWWRKKHPKPPKAAKPRRLPRGLTD